jgi:hypothetical protein
MSKTFKNPLQLVCLLARKCLYKEGRKISKSLTILDRFGLSVCLRRPNFRDINKLHAVEAKIVRDLDQEQKSNASSEPVRVAVSNELVDVLSIC